MGVQSRISRTYKFGNSPSGVDKIKKNNEKRVNDV